MAVCEHFTRRPEGTERFYETWLEWPQHAISVVAKIIHVDREAPLRLETHDAAHFVHESVVATGCKRHHCSFLEWVETEVEGDERIDHADAVEESAMPLPFN